MSDLTRPEPQNIDLTRPWRKFFDLNASLISEEKPNEVSQLGVIPPNQENNQPDGTLSFFANEFFQNMFFPNTIS